MLKGKVICGCCAHAMERDIALSPHFSCVFTRVAADAECYRSGISASELESTLFEIISKQAQTALASEPDVQENGETPHDIESLNEAKRNLYERFVLSEISAEDYRREKIALDEKISHLTQICTVIFQEEQRKKVAKKIVIEDALTRSLVDLLIEKVLIYPGEKIQIEWKIKNFLADRHN